MGVVEKAIEDCVPEGGIADDFVPVVNGHLAGEQGSTSTVAIIEDLQKIMACQVVEGGEAPVVEEEEMGSCEALQEPNSGSIAPGEPQFIQQPRESVVADAEPMTASLMPEGTGEVGFP